MLQIKCFETIANLNEDRYRIVLNNKKRDKCCILNERKIKKMETIELMFISLMGLVSSMILLPKVRGSLQFSVEVGDKQQQPALK